MSTADYENSPRTLLNRAHTAAHTYETLRIQDRTAVHTYETLQNQAAPTAVPNRNTVPPFIQNRALTAVHTYETLQNRSPTAVPNWNTRVPPILQNVPSPHPAYNAAPSTQMWTIPAMAPQWSVTRIAEPNSDPSSPFYQTFLKSKPRALGISLIILSILEIALGIGLFFTIFSITLLSNTAFWGPIFYIIAGSLTIAARAKPNPCLIRGSLSLNIISSIFSFVAVILNIGDLVTIHCYFYSSDTGNNDYYRMCTEQLNRGYVVLSILLIANVLLFCVSLSLSIFGCRSLSKVSSNVPQVFLIQNDVAVSMNPSTVPATFSGVAQTFPTANAPPPPYYVFKEVKASPTS